MHLSTIPSLLWELKKSRKKIVFDCSGLQNKIIAGYSTLHISWRQTELGSFICSTLYIIVFSNFVFLKMLSYGVFLKQVLLEINIFSLKERSENRNINKSIVI